MKINKVLLLGFVMFFSVLMPKALGADTIKIGANLDLTGSNAIFDQFAIDGAKLAIKEFNENGGFQGRKAELIVENNRGQISETTFAARRLVNAGAIGMITPTSPVNALAAATVSEEMKVSLISTFSTDSYISSTEKGSKPYSFQLAFSEKAQGEAMARFIYKSLGKRSAGIFIEENSNFTKAVEESFQKEFKKLGGSIVLVRIYKKGQTDFVADMQSMRSAGAEAIYAPGFAKEAGRIIRQARKTDWEVPIIGSDRWNPMELRPIAGYAALTNVYYVTEYDPDVSKGKAAIFKASYQKEYSKIPQLSAALAYDATGMILEAMKRAGSSEPAKVRAELEKTSQFRGATGVIEFRDGSHGATRSLIIMEMVLGREKFKQEFIP